MENKNPDSKDEKTLTSSKASIGKMMVVVFLILLVIFFVFWGINKSKASKYSFEYNGINFKMTQFGYDVEFYVNEGEFPVVMSVRNDPRELEDISIGDVKHLVEKKEQIYIAIDPYDNLTGKTTVAALEINYFIDNPYLYGIPVNSAFLKEFDDMENQTIKTCEDSFGNTTVVWLRVGDETGVFEEDGCLVVQGSDESEIIMAADRLVLTLVGIMA